MILVVVIEREAKGIRERSFDSIEVQRRRGRSRIDVGDVTITRGVVA